MIFRLPQGLPHRPKLGPSRIARIGHEPNTLELILAAKKGFHAFTIDWKGEREARDEANKIEE